MTPPLAPRQRAKKTKVRSGCATCKRRRVKCDERSPPPCVRCENLGLSCEYIQPGPCDTFRKKERPATQALRTIRPVQSHESSLAMLREPACANLDSQQALYFDIYRHRVATRFPYPDFWYRTVLRESSRDESVRDCVVALGALSQALYEERRWRRSSLSERNVFGLSESHREATRHYAQSLSKFRLRLGNEGSLMPSRSILIATFLFVVYELIQGNTKNADKLMINGILILRKHLAVFQAAQTSCSQVASAIDDEGVREAEFLLPRMAALNPLGTPFHGRLEKFGHDLAMQVSQTPVPNDSMSVEEIDIAWDVCTTRCALWAHRTARKTMYAYPDALEAARSTHNLLLVQYATWHQLISSKLEQETDPRRQTLLRVMAVGLQVSLVFGSCYLDKSEMAWDGFTAECNEALRLAESIVSSSSPDTVTGPVFDGRLITMVRIVAQNCRDRNIRKRALALSRQCAGNDATWNIKSHIIGLEVHAAAEEEGRNKRGHIAADKRYSWTDCVWNEDRTEFIVTLTSTVPDHRGNLVKRQIHARPEDHGFS